MTYISISDTENIPYEQSTPFAYFKSEGAIFFRFRKGKRELCIRKELKIESFPFGEQIPYSYYSHFITRKHIEYAKQMYKKFVQRIQYQQQQNGIKIFEY